MSQRRRKKITDDFLADFYSHQSQEHDALKQKMAAEGRLTRERLLAGQARTRELMIQHRLANNHQHREVMNRHDDQSASLARVERELAAVRQRGVEEESRVKEENKLLAAKYQATVASEGRLTRNVMEDGHERLVAELLRKSEEEANRQRLERLQHERWLEEKLESLRQEAAQRSAEDAAKLRDERADETRATEALRVWEADERDKDRKERRLLEKQRNEQLLDWKRAQEETQHRLEAERLAREEEFQRMQREAAKRDAERLAQDAETLRLHQEAAEKAEAAAEDMKSTVKQLRLERALAKEEREQVTSRLRFEEMGTGTGPKTATTGASTTTGSNAPPPSIAFQKENANPNRKSIHVQQLEQQVRALEGGKRKDEEEKKRLQKKFEMEAKEKERLLRQQRGKTRSERIESKKPEETAQGQRATEAAAFDKAKKQEGWRRSNRLRDGNPVKHGKPTYR